MPSRCGLPSKLMTPWWSRQNQSGSRAADQVRHAQHRAQAQHGQRLQVVGHQLGLVTAGQPVQELGGDRPDQGVDVGVDVSGPVLRVERAAQLVVALPVNGEDGRRAERPVDRRVVELGGEQLRMGADEIHILVAGDEPQADRRDEADRSLPAQPCVDRVRIVLQRGHGDRFGEGESPNGWPWRDRMEANEFSSRGLGHTAGSHPGHLGAAVS